MKGFLKKHKILFLSLPVLFSIFLLIGIAGIDLFLREYIFWAKTRQAPFVTSTDKLPFFKSPLNPDISAKAAVVMDNDSKAVLYAKNPDLLFSLASTAKIMTALVALEHYNIGDVLTVFRKEVGGVNVGFVQGEKLLFENVIYAMLLPSGNDAAFVLADNFPGGEEAFVNKMNEKAKEFNLNNTNFADPAGLEDKNGYTTPVDLAKIGSFALENHIFRNVVATKTKSISDVTGGRQYSLENLNRLLGVNGVNGIKTGYTDEAGQVLVTSKVQLDKDAEERTLIIVVMDSQDRFSDTEIILQQISDNINYLSIHP